MSVHVESFKLLVAVRSRRDGAGFAAGGTPPLRAAAAGLGAASYRRRLRTLARCANIICASQNEAMEGSPLE